MEIGKDADHREFYKDIHISGNRQGCRPRGKHLIGLGIVNGVIFLLHEKWKLMNFYPAKIIAMVVYMLWNFTANYLWTFG